MPSIYEITYIPWEGNNNGRPGLYSGSDYYDNSEYLGSASSTNIYEWAGGLTVRDWWIKETKAHPERFKKVILIECSNNISRAELQSLESAIQKKEDHRGDSRYFNRTNRHFNSGSATNPNAGMSHIEIMGGEKARSVSLSKSEKMKQIRSEKYWSSPGGIKLKNKTYEEIMGKEKTYKIKQKRSQCFSAAAKLRANTSVSCLVCKKITNLVGYNRHHGARCKHLKNT